LSARCLVLSGRPLRSGIASMTVEPCVRILITQQTPALSLAEALPFW
jgi:hypothetical protein